MQISDEDYLNFFTHVGSKHSYVSVSYLDNNVANRPIFLQLGYREEDLDKCLSMIYMSEGSGWEVDITFNGQSKPTTYNKIKQCFFSVAIHTEPTAPFGLSSPDASRTVSPSGRNRCARRTSICRGARSASAGFRSAFASC